MFGGFLFAESESATLWLQPPEVRWLRWASRGSNHLVDLVPPHRRPAVEPPRAGRRDLDDQVGARKFRAGGREGVGAKCGCEESHRYITLV